MSHSETRTEPSALIQRDFPCPYGSATGYFLCDRITFIFPCTFPPGLRPDTGMIWFVAADGTMESFRHRAEWVEGSWSTKCAIGSICGAAVTSGR